MSAKAIALLEKALHEYAENHEGHIDEDVLDDAKDLVDSMHDAVDDYEDDDGDAEDQQELDFEDEDTSELGGL